MCYLHHSSKLVPSSGGDNVVRDPTEQVLSRTGSGTDPSSRLCYKFSIFRKLEVHTRLMEECDSGLECARFSDLTCQ
jgi:hypothetical protein